LKFIKNLKYNTRAMNHAAARVNPLWINTGGKSGLRRAWCRV